MKTLDGVKGDATHPVFLVAIRSLTKDQGGTFHFDDVAMKALGYSLLQHRRDPTLPAGVIALFGLAAEIGEQPQGMTAAQRILQTLLRVRPLLDALKPLSKTPESIRKRMGTDPSIDKRPAPKRTQGGVSPWATRVASGDDDDR